MVCNKCGSSNYEIVSMTHGKIKKRGCLSVLIHIVLTICTAGLWLIIPLLRGSAKGKIKSNTVGVCRDCGNKFII